MNLARPLAAALALLAAASAEAQSRPAASAAPAAPPAAPAARSAERDDGDATRAMGTWALVVFNTRPFDFQNTGGADPIPLTVYTLGTRRWSATPLGPFRNFGVDLGVGLAFGRSSITQPQTGTLRTEDGPSTTGFGLHAGLPLALTHHRHAVFELVPEVDVIWASEKIPPLGGGETTRYGGWSVRVGARAGFEIFFGFVGLPQLAVEAGLGAAVTYDSTTSRVGTVERSTRRWGLATVRGDEPWSIFTGSVAAMYHF
jgi:hypothetical protein